MLRGHRPLRQHPLQDSLSETIVGVLRLTGNQLVVLLLVKVAIDSVGRVVVPKPLRDALGLEPGSEVEISRYGAGLQLIPAGRTAQVVIEGGVPVVTGDTKIDDEVVLGLLDAERR